MSKTLQMPEKTVDEIKNKLNCFVADIIEREDSMRALEMQNQIDKQHNRRLAIKLRDKLQEDPLEDFLKKEFSRPRKATKGKGK